MLLLKIFRPIVAYLPTLLPFSWTPYCLRLVISRSYNCPKKGDSLTGAGLLALMKVHSQHSAQKGGQQIHRLPILETKASKFN